MAPFHVSKSDLETICVMTLRHTIKVVERVEVRQLNHLGFWELCLVAPMPKPMELEFAMNDIAQLQKAFHLKVVH
jgi:hypothetical protein